MKLSHVSILLMMTTSTAIVASEQGLRSTRRKLWSRGSEYCYEDQSNPGDAFGSCWENKPNEALTPSCTLTSGTSTCKCPGNGEFCDVHVGEDSDTFEASYCSDKICYVPSSDETKSQCYCRNMVELPAFPKRGGRATEKCGSSWWKWGCCLFKGGYTWKDGKCQDKTRFMKEKCWDGGSCKDGSDGDSKTSCYEGRCYPWVSVGTRPQCKCDWFGWNVIFACSSDETCDGHACVWNTGNGNRYCDYGSSQNW